MTPPHRSGPRSNAGSPRRSRPVDADPARLFAVEVLATVHAKGLYANLVLPRALKEKQAQDRHFRFQDGAFAAEIVYGTLRQLGYLDFLLGKLTSRPLAQLDNEVLQCLRAGTYQLLFMRVPDHAAVSETVEVARQLCGEGPAKMINGVLRAMTRQSDADRQDLLAGIADPIERYAVEFSHPKWLVKAFEEALTRRGLPFKELPEALQANNVNPQVTLVARPGLIDCDELADEVEDVLNKRAYEGEITDYSVVIEGGDPGALPSIRAGHAAVQDEGSQLAALLLAEAPLLAEEPPAGDAPSSPRDAQWADLCAGPGGKTALLAAVGAPRGVHVDAAEIVPKRARLVELSTQALDNVTVTPGDGRTFGRKNQYDRVLVDAPCLGMGSLRRRPESRWRHSPTDLDDLLPLQRELFSRGVEVVRPGGVVAWVTCSPHVRETLDQVKFQLEKHGLELLDAASLAEKISNTPLRLARINSETVADPERSLVSKTVQLWPHRNGTDAMFIALLRKPIN